MNSRVWSLPAFTLVEVTITIVIMAMLIWLVFQIFITIWRIAVFTQLQKGVHNELIYTVQTIQNLVDDQEMQLTGYDLTEGGDRVTSGWKREIYMVNDTYTYTLWTSCVSSWWLCSVSLSWQQEPCGLWCTPDSGSVALTDPNFTHLESLYFRTLPYASPSGLTGYEQILHNWFWVMMHLTIPQYDNEKRRFRVGQDAQLFFTMRKYE